jgi:hypothetical protein
MAQGATAQAVVGGQADAANNPAQIVRLRNVVKNAAFYGNIYDNGMNAIVSGAHEGAPGHFPAGTTRLHGEVTVENDKITISKAGSLNNQIPASGTTQFFSRNPNVASVNATGMITAVSPGTAEIYAFVVAADRVFRSNIITVTVNNAGTPGTATPNNLALPENIRLGNHNALLETLEIEGLSGISSISGATMPAFVFDPNVRAYQMLADFNENSINLNAVAASGAATIEVEVNRKIIADGASNFNSEIPLVNGYNIIRLTVRAENGVDMTLYRLIVNKRAVAVYEDIHLSEIAFDGTPLACFSPDFTTYHIVTSPVAAELNVVPFDEFSRVDIILDNVFHSNTANIIVGPDVKRIVVNVSVNPDVTKHYVIYR